MVLERKSFERNERSDVLLSKREGEIEFAIKAERKLPQRGESN
jgi:hypothetical protein